MSNLFCSRFCPVCFLLYLLGGVAGVDAAPLSIGGTLSPVPAESEPINATRLHGGTVRFIGSGFSGTLTSTVWTSDASNPFGADKLTFTYLLTNDAASNWPLSELHIASFAGFTTDVGFAPFDLVGGPVGAPPLRVERSTADQILFRFPDFSIPEDPSGLLSSGSLSKLLVVQTNATSFAGTEAIVATSATGAAISVHSFAPITAIPEPTTLVLGGIGAIGLMVAARRAHKRSKT